MPCIRGCLFNIVPAFFDTVPEVPTRVGIVDGVVLYIAVAVLAERICVLTWVAILA